MKKSVFVIAILVSMFIFNSNVFAQKSSQPIVKAAIEGVSSGEISKALLLKTAKIECSDSKFKVIDFVFSVKKDSDIIEFNGTGNLLTVQMKNLIEGLSLGNKLVFEEINAKSDEGLVVELPAIVLVLK
jgi:hypothetical protein